MLAQKILHYLFGAWASLVGEVGFQGLFNRGPGQLFAQNYQWMFVINHPIQAGTEKVCGVGHSNPPEKIPSDNDFSEILPSEFAPYRQHLSGLARVFRADDVHLAAHEFAKCSGLAPEGGAARGVRSGAAQSQRGCGPRRVEALDRLGDAKSPGALQAAGAHAQDAL